MEPINVAEVFNEVDSYVRDIQSRGNHFLEEIRKLNKRRSEECKIALDEAVSLISETGVVIVQLRALSWNIYLQQRQIGGGDRATGRTLTNLRGEIRDIIYAVSQLGSAMGEVTRSLRSFLAY